MKILGREPALIIGALNALIMVAGALGFRLLAPDQAALWVTGVNALAAAGLALATRPLSPGVFSYLVASVIAIGAGYGLTLSPELVSMLNAAVVPVLALLTRGQVSPVESPITNSSTNPTPEAAAKDGLIAEDEVSDEESGGSQ